MAHVNPSLRQGRITIGENPRKLSGSMPSEGVRCGTSIFGQKQPMFMGVYRACFRVSRTPFGGAAEGAV